MTRYAIGFALVFLAVSSAGPAWGEGVGLHGRVFALDENGDLRDVVVGADIQLVDASSPAKSMPAVIPPPVTSRPSTTTRSATGIAPSCESMASDIQWVVARRPTNKPAAPRSKAPVQTEPT